MADKRSIGTSRRWATLIGLLLVTWGLVGCGTIRTTDTPRSGTEQLLLVSAWDTALSGVDFSPLHGRSIFVETSRMSGADKEWLIFRVRQALLLAGARLREVRDEADLIVEPGVGVYGTDSNALLVGIPQTGVVSAALGARGFETPELALFKRSDQYGMVRLALFAYEREGGAIVWDSGTFDADAYQRNTFLLGAGPLRSGTIQHPSQRRGMQLFGGLTEPRR